MRLLKDLDQFENTRGCVLSIGNFDGVHQGHQVILNELVALAEKLSVPAVVLTFDPHPLSLLRPEFLPPKLTTLPQKAELIAASRVNQVVAYQTDQSLLSLTPQDFFSQIILEKLGAIGLVEGPNFFFGKNREGNTNTLQDLCQQHKLELIIVQPQTIMGTLVSSSLIRNALKQGQIQEANELLGRKYAITGTVTTGAMRGRTIGFPTANLSAVETLIPHDGVYAALCEVNGTQYCVALNIGPNPTFADEQRKIEAHLLDFTGDLYGQTITLQLVERIRDLVTFENVNALQLQVQGDIELTRKICNA